MQSCQFREAVMVKNFVGLIKQVSHYIHTAIEIELLHVVSLKYAHPVNKGATIA